jgi:erythromycin esterase
MRRTVAAMWLALAFVSALGYTFAADDSRVAYLQLHAIKVRSISPDDRNFSDLEPLRQAIGSRRIVMLGEESHGDGATFLAKSRLIEFLHERMGFNVLAFESGFYDMHRAWQNLASGMDADQAIRSGVFSIWTNSHQTQPLWRYIASQSHTSQPLVLAGIDSQFTASASKEYFLADFNQVLDELPQDPRLTNARKRATNVLTTYFALRSKGRAGLTFFQKETPMADRALFYIALEKIRERLKEQEYSDPLKAARRDFWVQALASTSKLMEWLWGVDFKNLSDEPNPKVDYAAFNLRDQQMGENLVWLSRNEYADQKIIVWAATSHEMRHREFLTSEYIGYVPMGDWVNRVMGENVYTIGFTAFQGQAGIGEPWDIGVAAPGSIESLIHASGEEYALVDFRHLGPAGYWLTDPLSCRVLGYQAETADWAGTMDGLFYIKTMTPSTLISNVWR